MLALRVITRHARHGERNLMIIHDLNRARHIAGRSMPGRKGRLSFALQSSNLQPLQVIRMRTHPFKTRHSGGA
eukprot:6746149-Alexandrium_andersonii.AAC.1